PAEPPLAAAQVEDPPAAQRAHAPQETQRARVILGHVGLEPAVQGVEPGGDDRFLADSVAGVEDGHVALLARVSSRLIPDRTAPDTPENSQTTNPSPPSRNPCLST